MHGGLSCHLLSVYLSVCLSVHLCLSVQVIRKKDTRKKSLEKVHVNIKLLSFSLCIIRSKFISRHRPYAILHYLTYLYRQSFFTYPLFKMLTTLLKQTFQNGGKGIILCSFVYVLHLWKMPWITSPVLTTLKTDDINKLNNARSHTDGVRDLFA